jgi:hypothetical protein
MLTIVSSNQINITFSIKQAAASSMHAAAHCVTHASAKYGGRASRTMELVFSKNLQVDT